MASKKKNSLLKPEKKPHVSEKTFVKNLMTALRFKGCYVYKQNVVSFDVGGRFVTSGIPEGASDLVVIMPPFGFVLFVECKSSTGRQRETQVNFQREIEKRGAIYLLLSPKISLTENLELIKLACDQKASQIADECGFKLT